MDDNREASVLQESLRIIHLTSFVYLKISAQFEQEQFRKTLNSGTLNILIGIVETHFENAEDLNRLLIKWRQGFRKGCHAKQTSKIKYNPYIT